MRKINYRQWGVAHILFPILAILFGLIFIKIIPPLWGADESTHFVRVYELSKGNLIPDKVPSGEYYGGQLPYNLAELKQYVVSDLNDNDDADPYYGRDDVTYRDKYKEISSQKFSKDTIESNSLAASYSPIAYLGPLVGVEVSQVLNLNVVQTISVARLLSLLLYVLIITASLYLLRQSKWRWVIFIVALFPMSVFQASIISADSLAIALAFLLFGLYIRVWSTKVKINRLELISFAAIGAALPLTKPNYWLLLLPILFIPKVKWPSSRLAYLYKSGLALLTLLPLIAWLYLTKDISAAGTSELLTPQIASQINAAEQLKYIASHIPHFIQILLQSLLHHDTYWVAGTFGVLGWNLVPIPVSFILLLSLALVVAIFYSKTAQAEPINKINSWVLLLVGSACILSIIVSFYLVYTPVGYDVVAGVQGRYFIPAIPFVAYGLGNLLPIRTIVPERFATWFFSGLVSVCLLGSVYFYASVL